MSVLALFPTRTAVALTRRQHRAVSTAASVNFAPLSRHLHPSQSQSDTAVRCLSTAPPPDGGNQKTSFNPFSGMWGNYQDNKTKKNFRDQMEEVAAINSWNLGAYHGQLAKTAKSWKASVPGLRGMSEVKSAKDGFDIVDKMILAIGEDANVEDLYALGELEKLKIANEANLTVERLENEIRNFEAAAQTHRLIMMLKKQGKSVPDTPDEIRQLLMANARQLLTKPEKKRMEATMKKSMMSRMRGRR